MPGTLNIIYQALDGHFQGLLGNWWPLFGKDDPQFEILVGAVLVQQTRWEAVEAAVLRLVDANLLAPTALAEAVADDVAPLLKPVAFYRQKATGLSAISRYVCDHYDGNVTALLQQPAASLRPELLSLPRIGPETADVIMLYAGNHPVFVIDEYTRRLLERVAPQTHTPADRLAAPVNWRAAYTQVQTAIEEELDPPSPAVLADYYANYHALINEQCVRYCTARRPRCDGPPARRIYSRQAGRVAFLEREDGCPLRTICAYYRQQNSADRDRTGSKSAY